jgi:nucleoid DNA-binding protein
MITRAALSSSLRKSAELSHRAAALCVDVLLETIIEGIARGERIELRGFGAFEVRKVSSRRTGVANVPAHGRVVFRPCRRLRDTVWNTDKKAGK